jgi:hypothetical protein
MSATPQATTRPMRTRTLRDDLLDDLRQAAPMPAAQPAREVSVPVPVEQASARDAGAPTVDIAVTPRFWWGLRMKTLSEGPGVVIGAGPVRISLTGFRR